MRGGGIPTKDDFKKYSIGEQRGNGGNTTPPTPPPSTDAWSCIDEYNIKTNNDKLKTTDDPNVRKESWDSSGTTIQYDYYNTGRVFRFANNVKTNKGYFKCVTNGYEITWDDGEVVPWLYDETSSTTASTQSCASWNNNNATIEDLKNKKKVVKKCDKGEIVTKIQKRLKTYYQTELGGVFDTKFGDKTESAVKKFQQKMGLKDDGIVGDKTAKALFPETQNIVQSTDVKYGGGLKPEIETKAKDEGDLIQSGDDLFWKDEETKKKYMDNPTNIQNENYMVKLKNTVKEKLIETKIQKEKVITEEKIIKKRLELIFEDRKKLNINEISNKFIYEMFYLDSQKYSTNIINEETKKFFDTFKALLGDDKLELMADNLKEKMYNYLLTKLKVSKDDSFGVSLNKIIKSTPTQEIPKLFIDCGYLSNKLAKKMPIELVGKVQPNELDGPVVFLIKDLIANEMTGSEFSEKVATGLHKVLCPIIDNMRNNLETIFRDVKRRALNI